MKILPYEGVKLFDVTLISPISIIIHEKEKETWELKKLFQSL